MLFPASNKKTLKNLKFISMNMKKILLSAIIALSACLGCNAQIFYKISGNGLSQPSWLFGTHHLAPISILDSIPAVGKALDEAQQVVGEIDMTVDKMMLAAAMQPYMMAPADSTLRDLIAPADYDRISKAFIAYAPVPGATLDLFSMFRPMVATSAVSIGVISKNMPGYNPEQQLDTYFQLKGKEKGKKIKGLETPELQAKLLYTSIPLTSQAKDLVELLDNPTEVVEKGKQLNISYLSQNLEDLSKLSQSEDPTAEKFMEKLLNERNANWIKELPALMNDASCFIAVGALHLAGPQGLVEQLRKLGYTVEPIRK